MEPELEINPDLEKLRAYTQNKLALADQLRIIRVALTAMGRENGERQYGELIVKLAEDRFILAVLGQFKHGKSSLMNAVIGRELLPTGVLPLTSAITVLKYGPTEKLVVNRIDAIFPDELPISSLVDYVTERGNPANRRKVKTAYVELPVPFLRRGIEFVDTPGIGSVITANTATTYGFLPECDAVLFVTSVETPMTNLELEFLKEIREYVNKIFFVVNKIDLATDDEQNEVLDFVTKTVRAQMGSETVKLFPVSSRLGREAKTSGDNILYAQSGLKALEEDLGSFIAKEKSTAFLASIAHKALRILDEEALMGSFSEDALKVRVRTLQEEKTSVFHHDPHAAAVVVNSARGKLEILYKNIINSRTSEIKDIKDYKTLATETGFATESIMVAPKPSLFDIERDLKTKECPVCWHMTKEAMDFFFHWQYMIATKEQAQDEFAAEHGFCPLHTWQLVAVSSPQGASIGFTKLAEMIATNLKENNDIILQGGEMKSIVSDSRSCRVCELLRRAEDQYIRRLTIFIGDVTGQSQYRNSQGACLHHLKMLVNIASSAESREFLLSHAAQRFEEDVEDMRSYTMKREALRRALLNRNEEDAYRRVIIRIVGGRNVCMPWTLDRDI